MLHITLLKGGFPLDTGQNVLEENGRIALLLAGKTVVAIVAKIKFQQVLWDPLLCLMIVGAGVNN